MKRKGKKKERESKLSPKKRSSKPVKQKLMKPLESKPDKKTPTTRRSSRRITSSNHLSLNKENTKVLKQARKSSTTSKEASKSIERTGISVITQKPGWYTLKQRFEQKTHHIVYCHSLEMAHVAYDVFNALFNKDIGTLEDFELAKIKTRKGISFMKKNELDISFCHIMKFLESEDEDHDDEEKKEDDDDDDDDSHKQSDNEKEEEEEKENLENHNVTQESMSIKIADNDLDNKKPPVTQKVAIKEIGLSSQTTKKHLEPEKISPNEVSTTVNNIEQHKTIPKSNLRVRQYSPRKERKIIASPFMKKAARDYWFNELLPTLEEAQKKRQKNDSLKKGKEIFQQKEVKEKYDSSLNSEKIRAQTDS